MSCKRCRSDKQSLFNGEIAIHFRGLEGLDKPIVWVFQEIVVCMHCGLTEFIVPERELQILEQGSLVKDAVVLVQKTNERCHDLSRVVGQSGHNMTAKKENSHAIQEQVLP